MAVYDYMNRVILSLDFSIGTFDPVNNRYLDKSSKGIHAGYVPGATQPTKLADRHGISFDGGDYLTGATQGWFNQAVLSFCFLFRPGFIVTDGASRAFFDTTAGSRLLIIKDAGNDFYVQFAGINLLVIARATYEPYWKLNQYNTLVVSATTGLNTAWMNGIQIGTSATAWAAVNPATYWVGSRNVPDAFFLGALHQVEAYPIWLTQLQATDWHFNALRRVNDT